MSSSLKDLWGRGVAAAFSPEYDGQCTDTSDPERQEERMWRRRRVPEESEVEKNSQRKGENEEQM